MADGDVIYFDENIRVWGLLKAAVASTNGQWVDTGPNRRGAVLVVSGTSGDTVSFQGLNSETKPSNATDGEEFASITGDGPFQVGDLSRWVKTKFTFSAGSVTAELTASRG